MPLVHKDPRASRFAYAITAIRSDMVQFGNSVELSHMVRLAGSDHRR
jgi:hypothetical protein